MTEKQVRDLCRQREIKIERVGIAWKLTGTGISLLVADLRLLGATDLSPVLHVTERSV